MQPHKKEFDPNLAVDYPDPYAPMAELLRDIGRALLLFLAIALMVIAAALVLNWPDAAVIALDWMTGAK